MVIKNIFVFLIVFVIAISIVHSFQTNSSNYKNAPLIVSSGGEIANSSNYKTYAATGIVAGITNSSTYKNLLGFFYGWLLADGQSCTAANQCEGGFCCSNACSSSTCPTGGGGATGGGGGGGEAAGGGGGGAINFTRREAFVFTPTNVKTKLVLGSSAEELVTIENTGNLDLSVLLSVEGVEEYLSLSDSSLDLEGSESTSIILDFLAKRVGGFTGQIIATAGEIRQTIPIIFEVITKLVLFDVKLDIPSSYSKVEVGGNLRTQITLLNVGAPELVDVFVTYFIKDLKGNVIYEETETFAVEKQRSYVKSFKIFDGLELGSYVVIAEVRYADSFAVSSQLFRVVEKKTFELEEITKNSTVMIVLALMLTGFLLLLVFKILPIRRMRK